MFELPTKTKRLICKRGVEARLLLPHDEMRANGYNLVS